MPLLNNKLLKLLPLFDQIRGLQMYIIELAGVTVTEVQRKGDGGEWTPWVSISWKVCRWEKQPSELLLYVQLNACRDSCVVTRAEL